MTSGSSCRPRGRPPPPACRRCPGEPHHYRAPDYETLVDSPIVAGNPAVHEFTVEGKPHYLVDVGEDGVFDGERAARDLARIVREDARLWGGLPYDKYLFLNMLTGGGGGMEHSNSTALMSDRWNTRTRRELPALAGSRQPRVLPRLEREAAASRRVDAGRV